MKTTLKNNIVGIFNTDFGASYGFGIDDYYKIKDLAKKGYINKLIFRDKDVSNFSFDYKLVVKAIPLGNLIPRCYSALQIYSKGKIRTTYYDQKTFDFFAKAKIPKLENGILFTVPSYPSCVSKAKELNYKVVLSVGAHPKWISNTYKSEYVKYGIPLPSDFEQRIFDRQLDSLKKADFLISLSEFHKQTLVENGFPNEKIFFNSYGVDLETFKQTENLDNKLRFLFLSHISLTKGLQYLLKAWENLKIKNAELIICGRCFPEFQNILKYYVNRLDSIKYVGPTQNPNKFYENSSVFILPSLIEGMSRAVLEAMSSGIPPITTKIAAPYLKNDYDGIVIPPRDIKAIENAILFFYDNRKEITRMGNNARKTVEKLSWASHSSRMVEIFEQIF